MKAIKKFNPLNLLLDFIAPKTCLACAERIANEKQNEFICQSCLDSIPFAPNSNIIISEMTNNFDKDDIAIIEAFSLIGVSQDSKYMNLIYLLKYKNFPYSVSELYQLLARKIKFEMENQYDFIIPLPLHTSKQRERGYNQSKYIAEGIAQLLNLEIKNKIVERNRYTRTQTMVSKAERFTNIKNAFVIPNKNDVIGKSILIVDDVFTTGSSINECANTLLEAGAKRIAATTLVYAGKY